MPDPPEGHKGPRDRRTRRERLAPDDPGLEPPLPFHPELQDAIDLLYEVGPTSAGEVITWGEINAWCERTGTFLEPWLALLLRRLSAEFVHERAAAANPLRRKPERDARDLTEGLSPAAASSLSFFLQAATAPAEPEPAAAPDPPPPVRRSRPRAKARPSE